MKRQLLRRRFVRRQLSIAGGVVCVGVALFATRALHSESHVVAGHVSYLEGDASRSDKEGGTFKKLKVDADLFEGDVLKTDEGARLEARLNDKSILRLAASSSLKLEQAKFSPSNDGEKKFSAKLFAGRLWAKVTSLLGDDSKFEVSTPNAVAGVRGTVFGVDHGADKSTTVRVFSGKVLVSNKPVYLKEGTKKFDGTQKSGTRTQVAGPQEVSKKQWEESIAGALQQIRVAGDGGFNKAEQFAQEDAGKDEWTAWNQARDSK